MKSCILAMDMGGTAHKYALMDARGEAVYGTVGQRPSLSQGSREDILGAIREVAREAASQAKARGLGLDAVSIAAPGPFDFDRGAFMAGHKFAAVYGMPLGPLIALEAGPVPIHFLHDSTAFLLGEYAGGAARGYRRPAGMMLGTGCGFAAMAEGRVLVQPDQRPATVLWNRPFRGQLMDDILSRRGIRAAYAGNAEGPDVHEIAERAFSGEPGALRVFAWLAEAVAEALEPVLRGLQSDALVLGGQIAKSSALFAPRVSTLLGLPVHQAAQGGNSALFGAWVYASLGRERCVKTVHAQE